MCPLLSPPHKPLRLPPLKLPICCVALNSSAAAVPTSNINEKIKSLCKKGRLKQALKLLSAESNPTQRTYELLHLSCIQKSSPFFTQILYSHISSNGRDQDPFLATKLINLYSELSAVDDARQVFDKTRERTIYVWNAIFRALYLAGKRTEVLNLYREMNCTGIQSDRFTYTYMLKACVVYDCLTNTLLNKGKEIHANVLRRGYDDNFHIMTTLVDMYARFGCVSYASSVFRQMPVRNIVTWSVMIACFAKNGKPDEELELFREMILETRDLNPNPVTMISVLQVCAALAALGQGKLIHGYILRRGFDSILPVANALLTMYARCGELEVSQRIFDQMEERDVVSWNSLISAYGLHGFGKKSVEIFEEMIHQGVSPSPISFLSVLGACSHAYGLVEEGKKLFDSMAKEHKIYPSIEHYSCMVDFLGRANRLEEAARFIEAMRIEPNARVWGSLLGSCRIHCNVELAERACSKLFELEPRNAGNYILLADIYAEAKMWDDVKRVRKLLETRELHKVTGKSWIEVEKQLLSFVAVEMSDRQIEGIHAFVIKLAADMKEKGYVPLTKIVLYDVDEGEKEMILLGHSEKLAVAYGLINTSKGEPIRITKNLRLCEDCHTVSKFISNFASKEILVGMSVDFMFLKMATVLVGITGNMIWRLLVIATEIMSER